LARLLAALLAVAAPAVVLSQTAPQHPHLLYSAGDVARLRAQASTSHAYMARALKAGVDEFMGTTIAGDGTVTWPDGRTFNVGDRRDVGNGVAVFAFYWQLDGGDAYLQLARRWLLAVTSLPSLDLEGDRDLVLAHVLTGTAIAYDVLHPKLTDAERTQVRRAIAEGANALMGYGRDGGWWEHEFLQNHNWINHAAVGLAALAVEGEVAAATTAAWRDYATANARTVRDVTDPIVDGTWHESPGYLGYGYMFQLPYAYALKRAGGEDLTDMAILRGDASLRAHGQLPEQPNAQVLTYADFYAFGLGEGLMQLRYSASQHGDRVAQAVADRQVAVTERYVYAVEQMEQIFEYLWYDPSIAAADLSTLPLDWYGPDLSGVIFRSGWEKGATIFAMKSGPYGGQSVWQRIAAGIPEVEELNFGHDHADDGGIYLYGNGSWLAPEALGYYIGHPESPGPQANRTIFHNALTIDGQGQLGEGVRSTDRAASYTWYRDRSAGIPFHASSRNEAYAISEGGKLYAASLGLSRWDRHVLFLDRSTVVVRDVVKASAPHDYHFVAHFMEGAVRDGSWIRGTGKNGQSLGVAVVSPAQWGLTATQQAPNRIVGLNPNGYVWAAEVAPSAPAKEVTFLTALVPSATAAWASRPSVAPLDAARPDVGLVVTSGSRVASAIFSDDASGTPSAGGLALAGLAGMIVTEGAAPARALLVQGTSLSQGGRVLVSQDGTSSFLEADGLSGTELELTGDLLGQATIRAPLATRVTWWGQDVPFVRDGEVVHVNEVARPDPDPGTGGNGGVPGTGGGTTTDPGSAGGTGGTPADPQSQLATGPAGGACATGAASAELLAVLGLAGALRRRRRRWGDETGHMEAGAPTAGARPDVRRRGRVAASLDRSLGRVI
jgi:hypothetical protein